MVHVLVVEDDIRLNQIVCASLRSAGYDARGCTNAAQAFDLLHADGADIIISDIMMPGIDGFEFVADVRSVNKHIPILLMTALDDMSAKRKGFGAGIDDYMVKPINIGEMVLRVSALLRRAQMASERRQVIGGTVMECDSLSVTVDGESMVLPQKEFMLLYKMASFPGRIFTRQQLMDDIWGYDSSTDTHTVDVHIARLRERFRDNLDFKIVTMRGVGYKVVRT